MFPEEQAGALRKHLGRAAFQFKAELENRFQSGGYAITAPQWALLHAVRIHQGAAQKELARRTFKDKTNVARILASLEDMELISRRRDEQDQRYYRVFLTPQGRQAEKELRRIAHQTLSDALRGIPQNHLESTMRTLEQIHRNLEQSSL